MVSPSLTKAANNLRQIGLATINYAASRLPTPPAAGEKLVHPGLSWRVAILPFIEEDVLYRQFHLDEPWDSPHNKELLPLMPKIYAIPGEDDPPGMTRLRALVGKGTAFEKLQLDVRSPADARALNLTVVPNTILVVKAAEAVPWTKPDELVYDPNGPLPQLSTAKRGPRALMANGSVLYLDPNMPDEEMRKLIAP
jgi:hypothetical protein